MDRYIQQLIEDFRQTAQKVPTSDEVQKAFSIEIPEELEMVAYAELYLRVPPQKLSKILGIEKVMLPPIEKLLPGQIVSLYKEMIRLLNAYYFYPDFPPDLPIDVKYRLLYEQWDHEHIFIGEGSVHIEFCNYEPNQCPFPEGFCRCEEFSAD